mgnify:CR=1 FL=1
MRADSQKRAEARKIYRVLTKTYPHVTCELDFKNPLQLLIATVLSAQCTDKRVNIVTRELFKHFPTPQHLAATHFDELFPHIRSISYPNNKTKHLIGLGKMLIEDFGGEVPSTVEELVKLPGVGRKTANVVMNTAFGAETFAVDTHIFRVGNRTGIAPGKTVIAVEKALEKSTPKPFRVGAHHWLILHGRYTCLARQPKCAECGIQMLCAYYTKEAKKADSKRRSGRVTKTK